MCIRKDGTVNRKWEDFLCSKVSANAKPINGVSTVDVVVDFDKDVWVRLFIPNKVWEKFPLHFTVVMYLGFGNLGQLARNWNICVLLFLGGGGSEGSSSSPESCIWVLLAAGDQEIVLHLQEIEAEWQQARATS